MDKEIIKKKVEKLLGDFLLDAEALNDGKLGSATKEELISRYSEEVWQNVEDELPHWFTFLADYYTTGGCPSIVCGGNGYYLEIAGNMRLSISELETLPKK